MLAAAGFAIGERYFALEADMGTESIEAIIKPKISGYRQIVATGTIDGHFGVDNLAVLFVTTNEKHMRNMMKAVESIARNVGQPRSFRCGRWRVSLRVALRWSITCLL
jgi:hypothetical protein